MHTFLILLVLIIEINAKVVSKNWTITQDMRNPDGVYKLVYLINNKFLEENIICNYGDTIDLIVTNNLYMETLSLHFHGIDQKTTPFMDGVSYVTQYPIIPGQSFRYYFDITQSGTYWIHSHMSSQYSDGLFASLIIRDSNDKYDITNSQPLVQGETVIIINDWYHQSSSKQITMLKDKVYQWYFPAYTNVLWNGQGYFNCSKYCNGNNQFETQSTIYNCETKRYPVFDIQSHILPLRMRIINMGGGLTLVFSIDSHNLIVISVDGVPVEHFTTKRILIYVGQRYDILVYPLRSHIKAFWMRTNTLDYPIGDTEQSLAILSYNNSTEIPMTTAWSVLSKNLSNLETNLFPVSSVPKIIDLKDVYDVNLNFTCSYTEFSCAINGISYKPSFEPIILQQYYEKEITNPSVIKIPFNRYIRLIINNPLGKQHPLHGHLSDFWILGVGKVGDGDYNGQQLNYVNPVYRDTIQVNEHSWIVLLFYNGDLGPRTWHCHLEYHQTAGMFLIFINDVKIPPPPNYYPMISNFKEVSKSNGFLDLDKMSIILLVIIFILILGIIMLLILNRFKRAYERLWG